MKIQEIFRMALACTLLLAAHGASAACLSSEVESNNSDSSANTGACSGTAISGTIASSTDVDWFKLDVTGPGTISINLAHDSGIDLDWYLYKAPVLTWPTAPPPAIPRPAATGRRRLAPTTYA